MALIILAGCVAIVFLGYAWLRGNQDADSIWAAMWAARFDKTPPEQEG